MKLLTVQSSPVPCYCVPPQHPRTTSAWSSSMQLRRAFGKQRTFCHTKIFIDNRKETEYAGFITHLHLLLHIVTLNIEAFVVPWHQFTFSLLVPEGRPAILRYCKCSVTISYTTVWDTSGQCSYTSLIVKCRFSRMMRPTFCFNASVMTEGRPYLSASWTSVRPFLNIVHHFRTLVAFITCSSYTATGLRWI